MTRVMLVDDNEAQLSLYENYLTKDKDIEIVAQAKDGEKALELYSKTKPDLMFLDLELPKLTGLDVINSLSNDLNEIKKCNIVVCSGKALFRSSLTRTEKVFRILSKPFSLDTITNTIKDYNSFSSSSCDFFPSDKLRSLLIDLSIDLYSTGSKYLVDVIKFSYNHPNMLDSNLKNIFFIIGSRNNCSSEAIRSSIRHSVKSVEKHTSEDVMYSIFHISKNKYNKLLTPKYFLESIIEYLKN